MKKSLTIIKPFLSTLWKGLVIAGCIFVALQIDRWYSSDGTATPVEPPLVLKPVAEPAVSLPADSPKEPYNAQPKVSESKGLLDTMKSIFTQEAPSRVASPAQKNTPKTLSNQELTKKTRPCLCFITTSGSNGDATGSGFFMKQPDLVITNFHVIHEARNIKLQDMDGNYLEVLGVLGWDEEADLAILQVRRNEGKFLSLSKSPIEVGDELFIMGNPKGLQGSISLGVISGLRQARTRSWLQLSADISPGSSGSPVLNKKGLVIGVATFTLDDGVSQNLNFASHKTELKTLVKKTTGFFLWGKKGKLISITDFRKSTSKLAEIASIHDIPLPGEEPELPEDEPETIAATPEEFPVDQLNVMSQCWRHATDKDIQAMENEIQRLLKFPELAEINEFIEGCREFSSDQRLLAYESFKTALQERPQSAFLWEVAGENAALSSKISEATAFFIVSLQLNPHKPEVWAKTGIVMRGQELYKSAGIYAQKVAVGYTPHMRDTFVNSGMWLPEITGEKEHLKWRELYSSYFWTEVMPASPSNWHEHVLDVRKWEGLEKAKTRLEVGYEKTDQSPDLEDLMQTLQ